MNEGFPPLNLSPPEIHTRKKEKPRLAPLPPELLAKRDEIARVLNVKVGSLSRKLKALSADERKAIFYKLEHDIPVNPAQTLSGTDLKAISQPSPETVFAIPKEDDLGRLAEKIKQFGEGNLKMGHAPNEWVAHLTDISEADPKDRLSPDLRKRFSQLIKRKNIICEIEFLTLLLGKRKQLEQIEEWLKELQTTFANGVHGSVFEHEVSLPTCRAVIRCTGSMFEKLVEEGRWIESIRSIESRPKFQTFQEVLQQFRFQDLAEITSPPADAPVVCVLDSGVTSGNPFLEKVVRPDLSKSFLANAPDNPNDEHGHGSAVASLCAYYSLNIAKEAQNIPKLWIAAARILDANNKIENERLFSAVVEEAVKHFVSKGVKIFCLAVGDDRRIWSESRKGLIPRQSWVARRLDQLSRRYDVVFVTCTGNIDLHDLREFVGDDNEYPHYFDEESVHLLDPGQAALALTTGSICHTTQIVLARDSFPMALRNQPSPFTRMGPGIRKEIKPEVVDYGGNLAIDGSTGNVRDNRGLQVVAASKQLSPAASYWSGTSFAVPRIAHKLALINQDLLSLGVSASSSLLRAFLVNSARHREENGELADLREKYAEAGEREKLHMLLGYGLPDADRATGCDDYSVVCFFQGEIEPDRVAFFDVPVPSELSDSDGAQQLTVTVAFAPEVQRWGLERYLGADVKWRMYRGDKSRDDIIDAMSEPTDESDVITTSDLFASDDEEPSQPKELPFKPSVSRRSRGTVQHATYHWSRHQQEYSDGSYVLAVAAYKRWSRKVAPIPIAVVVRLEDLGRKTPIYAEVQAQVEVRV